MDDKPLLRCPKCLSRVVMMEIAGEPHLVPFGAVAACNCEPDCPMRKCILCHYEGHEFEFDAEADMPKLYNSHLQDAEPDYHPTASTECHFPRDDWLRRHKFRIEHRRKGQEPIWSKAFFIDREGEIIVDVGLCRGGEPIRRVEIHETAALVLIHRERKLKGEKTPAEVAA